MTFMLFAENMTPAEGESTVRTYHCTSLSSRLLSLKAQGYLTVSNKRVVFYATGSSYAGRSILQSEVPIADVSGLTSYKGTYFSLLHLIIALVVSFVVGNILGAIVAAIAFLIAQEMGDRDILVFVPAALGAGAVILSLFFKSDKLLKPILAATGALLFASASGMNLLSDMLSSFLFGGGGGTGFMIILALIAGIYALVSFFLYARRETMSLAVGSKGGSSTPIAISGISGFGLYNTAALRALTAEPAADAEAMIKELGAMITDIQTLGDLGIQKWTLA